MNQTVTLAHGSGGKQTSRLIEKIFKKHFDNPYLTADDAAVLPVVHGKLAMSTDSFIVSPAFFNGGNIGKLAVCGTVNDLACMGAKTLYMTCGFVIEEGFSIQDLETVVCAMADTAREVGIQIVAGDTKVAGKGQVDGIFINTTGVGQIPEGKNLSGANARNGDVILVTGDVGRHGCTILLERDDYGIDADVKSDCAPLWEEVKAVQEADVHVIRDATRGGVGTVLYEIAHQSNLGVRLFYEDVPVQGAVKGVCGLLGLEPLYLACEGTMVMIVSPEDAQSVLHALKQCSHGQNAAIIGEMTDAYPQRVVMKTEIGAETILPEPGNELLPRIC